MIAPHKIRPTDYVRFLVAVVLPILISSGCTEMKIEGDAKIFQSSAVGTVIGALLGLGLLALGALSVVASFWPDRKPRNEYERLEGGTPTSQRVGLAIFGAGMGFMGFFLTIISLLFPNSLHVTVYPDRVEMASTFNQARGKEVVVPFSKVKSVEIIEERGIGRKRHSYLVFTLKDGGSIRQQAGNNELQALDTIQQSLTEYQKNPPPEKPSQIAAAPQDVRAASPSERDAPPRAPESGRFGVNTRVDPASNQSDAVSAGDLVVGTLQNATSPGAPASLPAKSPLSSLPPVAPKAKPPGSATASTLQGSLTSDAVGSSDQFKFKRYPITIAVPADYEVVGPDTVVDVGMKLKACYAGSWSSVTVVAINGDGSITCNWDDWKSYTYKMLREDLTIPKAGASSSPTTAASSPTPSSTPSRANAQYSLKRYVINIPIPAGYALVRPDTQVKIGMKLGACYAGHWEPVTVVAINSDGTITCDWDKWPGFTYKMVREDLTIATR